MNAAELARQAGTSAEKIERLAELGILEARPGDDPFDVTDIHRVRFTEALDAAGVSLDDLARLVAEGKYTFEFIEGVFPGTGWPLLDRRFEEVADELGLPWTAVQQLYTNWGLPPPARDQRVREDDVIALSERAEVGRLGNMDPDTLVAASRFFGDNIRRMAASQVRFFVDSVMGRMREAGLSRLQVLQTIGPLAYEMQGYSNNLRHWLYERHLETFIFQTAIEVVEEVLEEAGYETSRSAQDPAIAFLDLGGYTRLTEESGDQAAAELSARLGEVVGLAARRHGGQPVKLLGDGVMFHFGSPPEAVQGGLELVASAEQAGLPPARMGVHTGPVVFRDGDYFGQTVNVAARITDYARPGEVLVSSAVASAAGEHPFEPIGEVPLRGVLDPVSLFRALSRDDSETGQALRSTP